MKKNFKLTIEYDGTDFHGWQRQKTERTVQEEIEKVLKTITTKKITLTGSGRTDAGVHALGQVAHFKCNTKLSPETFLKGLNSLLPQEIVILSCDHVDDDFHARFNVKSKIYNYRILNQRLPSTIFRQYTWHIPKKLNVSAMRRAIQHIKGEHDFSAFEGTGSPRSHSIRNMMKAEIKKDKNGFLVVELEANGFLKFMVRNIVGTLVDVGLVKISSDRFKEILLSKDRNLASPTAPPQGLFLVKVNYE
jgi:tRNA pseudouridine38-40 synthase